jgi:nucleotide-binding universal stress UspA family protein
MLRTVAPMKTILVPVEANDTMASTFRTAKLLAGFFDSYIEGFALTQTLNPFLAPDMLDGTIDAELRHEADAAVRGAGQAFARFFEGDAPNGRSFNSDPRDDAQLASYARIFDIVALGRPGSADASPRMATLEAVLFGSGRPALIAPPDAPARLAESIVVAWNRSAETARTIAFAMPLLKRARQLTILSVEGGTVAGPDGEALARQLDRHGIRAEVVPVRKVDAKSVGPAVLEHAARLGSDLIVKGAFTQGRLSQLIFGGATLHILAEATAPVFMAH